MVRVWSSRGDPCGAVISEGIKPRVIPDSRRAWPVLHLLVMVFVKTAQ
ncbi:hypothetical protein ACNKHL_21535 [Shigella flexneri]